MKCIVAILLTSILALGSLKYAIANTPHLEVFVFDCQDRYVAIWSDSRRTIPLTNPFYVNDPKHIEFYTSVSCISVNVKAVR